MPAFFSLSRCCFIVPSALFSFAVISFLVMCGFCFISSISLSAVLSWAFLGSCKW
jgi:hypothetical protein